MLSEDRSFIWTVMYFLDGNGSSRTSIDVTFVVTNRFEEAIFIKDGPILLD